MVYLERILLPQLWKGAIIVMDNLPVHHAKTVETLIKSFGVNVKFLPPYSPDLSPIELSGVKNQRDYAFALLPEVQRLLMPRSPKQSMGLQMKMLSTGLIIVVYF
jgi:transposase